MLAIDEIDASSKHTHKIKYSDATSLAPTHPTIMQGLQSTENKRELRMQNQQDNSLGISQVHPPTHPF